MLFTFEDFGERSEPASACSTSYMSVRAGRPSNQSSGTQETLHTGDNDDTVPKTTYESNNAEEHPYANMVGHHINLTIYIYFILS